MYTADAREQMIEQQVRAWDVLDERVLDVMRQVPRELFVPQTQRYRAYADVEVPLARAQHMLRPSVAGRLLQALAPQGAEKVLEIGAGTGFITACLRAMATHVTSLEVFPDLAEEARRNLALLGMRDVTVVDADALQADSGARYDAIALTASLPTYDARFERMLAPRRAPVRGGGRSAGDGCTAGEPQRRGLVRHAEPVRDGHRSARERRAASAVCFLNPSTRARL